MWTVVKFDKKNLSLFKEDLNKKFGADYKIYIPKIRLQKFKNNKLVYKNVELLGDYLFCFHQSFNKQQAIDSLKFSRGLKHFLDGFYECQEEISFFIRKCKDSETDKGFLSKNFFDLKINKKYKFSSGPFTNMIFKIIDLQRNKIKVLVGDLKTTINRNEFLFSPL